MVKPANEDDYTPEEAQRRFEKAVDKALKTPPVHREGKPAAKAKPKAKKAKD